MTSGDEHSEHDIHAPIICLTHKILSSGKYSDDLSVGFHRSTEKRLQKLSGSKGVARGNFRFRNLLFFGFVEHQEKATSGLGYMLTLIKTNDAKVVSLGCEETGT